jgi:RNA polymerase sigma-70 factor (ECF subfamily)
LEPLRGALEAYCRNNVNEPGAMEDVLQSAVASAFRDFHLYVENTNFRAWIFKYVHLETLNWNRRRRAAASPESLAEIPALESWESVVGQGGLDALLQSPEAVLDDCEEELARALRELPEPERAVMLLRAIGEFKYREIGEILEMPVGSVMGYLGRARAHLRRRLADYCHRRGVLRPRQDPEAGGGAEERQFSIVDRRTFDHRILCTRNFQTIVDAKRPYKSPQFRNQILVVGPQRGPEMPASSAKYSVRNAVRRPQFVVPQQLAEPVARHDLSARRLVAVPVRTLLHSCTIPCAGSERSNPTAGISDRHVCSRAVAAKPNYRPTVVGTRGRHGPFDSALLASHPPALRLQFFASKTCLNLPS